MSDRTKDPKSRPILFSAPMVRAILEGRKTQTRRIMKPQPRVGRYGVRHPTKPSGIIGPLAGALGGGDYHVWEGKRATACLTENGVYVALRQCPYGETGDELWVRETWRPLMDHLSECTGPKDIRFAASVGEAEWAISKWKPAIHMPRWASRITLLVTEVRIQRLHEITEADARAEGAMYHDGHGVGHSGWRHDYKDVHADARSSFARLWCEINGTDSWNANPWVWVVCFERALDRRAAA